MLVKISPYPELEPGVFAIVRGIGAWPGNLPFQTRLPDREVQIAQDSTLKDNLNKCRKFAGL